MKGKEEKRETETRRCCVNRRGKGKGEGKGERLDGGTARTCTYTEKKQKRLADLALTRLSLPWHGAPHRSRCPFETDATESFILLSKTTEQSCSASSTERRSCSWPFQLLTMLPPFSTEKLRFTDLFFPEQDTVQRSRIFVRTLHLIDRLFSFRAYGERLYFRVYSLRYCERSVGSSGKTFGNGMRVVTEAVGRGDDRSGEKDVGEKKRRESACLSRDTKAERESRWCAFPIERRHACCWSFPLSI